MFSYGQRVCIETEAGEDVPGVVAGCGILAEGSGPVERGIWLVRLDRPVWVEGRATCVSLLAVHGDNLRGVCDGCGEVGRVELWKWGGPDAGRRFCGECFAARRCR